MNSTHSRFLAGLILVALALTLAPARAASAAARLEGRLMDIDGEAARGYRVHLIDGDGRDVAQSATSDEGIYRFRDLESGSYALGIESPEGHMAPVATPPVRLESRQLARRDIKLVEANEAQREAVGLENPSFGIFWAGLSPVAKAWSVIGAVVIVGIAVQALDDEDAASTISPN